ncbi:Tropinone reductase-like [Vitis vinifera]|uniref:Tropinone reductase-like n=1 Tax=Vitis vinifera TaxID=29760 RepID=A0A438ENU4_VITVI|nr:Tropinone reductase-like [Vitis vinifera]
MHQWRSHPQGLAWPGYPNHQRTIHVPLSSQRRYRNMAESNGSFGGSGWSLRGATALVTGGTRGIGYAVVEELAGLGATVHTCSRNEAELDKCLREWHAKGFSVTASICDGSDRAQREKLMEKVSSIFNGKLNILVNNVGTSFRKPTVDYTAAEYSTIMTTNLESAYHLCQLAHPLLKASGVGSIVFVSSVAGVVSLGTGSIYAATKAAINQLTKNFACEWAKDNIRSNSVAPWYIKTSLVEHVISSNLLILFPVCFIFLEMSVDLFRKMCGSVLH